MITFQTESFTACIPELKDIIDEHYQELALFKDKIPLAPRWEIYELMEGAGKLSFQTVRDDGRLVGYYISVVDAGLHYKHQRFASVDIFFIKPEYRKTEDKVGTRLIQFMEQEMRKLGVSVIFAGSKLHKDCSKFFEALGYEPAEVKLCKFIGD